jgi:hypothetical protein
VAQTSDAAAGIPFAQSSTVANLKKTMAATERPVCDEWGMYDPEQAGFEAIVRRLLANEDEGQHPQASGLPRHVAESTR